MKIYLVRHGDSVFAGYQDDDRPLSKKGVHDIKHLAMYLKHLNFNVKRIIHSLKYRAQETAEIIALALPQSTMVEVNADLDPDASLQPMIEIILNSNTDLMLVGHMPFLGKLASKLICDNEDRNTVYFSPGSIVCLEQIQNYAWCVSWMLNPAMLPTNIYET